MGSEFALLGTSLAVSALAGCSAISGAIAFTKRRSPLEGVLLGLLLGPIGILVECRNPTVRRPMVDENAWNSLRFMMNYQERDREPDRRD